MVHQLIITRLLSYLGMSSPAVLAEAERLRSELYEARVPLVSDSPFLRRKHQALLPGGASGRAGRGMVQGLVIPRASKKDGRSYS